MKATVLDASALLAMFFGEPGMEKMRELFHKASEADHPVFISAVNWAEVLYRMERKHGKPGYDTARQFEQTTPLEAVPMDRELAEAAALLKTNTTWAWPTPSPRWPKAKKPNSSPPTPNSRRSSAM